jgi:hypothetical protein
MKGAKSKGCVQGEHECAYCMLTIGMCQKGPFFERSIQCQKGGQHGSKGGYLGG